MLTPIRARRSAFAAPRKRRRDCSSMTAGEKARRVRVAFSGLADRIVGHRDELPAEEIVNDHPVLDRQHDDLSQAVGELEGKAVGSGE